MVGKYNRLLVSTGPDKLAEKSVATYFHCRTCAAVVTLFSVGSWAATICAQGVPPPPASVRASRELAVRRAQENIRYGLELGSRQAIYSAQSEFLQALRLIARDLDTASATHGHEAALEAGWQALETLESPKPIDMQAQTFPAADPATSHAPPTGAGALPSDAPTFRAMQRQLCYAQERLAYGGGHEPAASMALYALSLIHI